MASNNLLALLVVIALLFSLGTLFFNLNLFKQFAISITGLATGTATANVAQTVSISLPIDTVAFNSISVNQTNDTIDYSPSPFILQNDGTIAVNVTIGATDLWTGSGAGNPSQYYQFNTTRNETLAVPSEAYDFNCTAGVNGPFCNMATAGSPTKVVSRLNFTSSSDAVLVQINITVPTDESAGAKSSTVTFTGSAA